MFITFEGLDFCGKSTQVELLRDYYLKKNAKIKVIREPGGTEISEKIREVLLDKKNLKMTVESEILLFSASRAQLVREVIKPALLEGTIIISDRFHDSLTAYQGFGRNIPLDFVEAINKFVIGDCIPDITFFIDLNLEEIEKRKSNSRLFELDRIEFMRAGINGMLSALDPYTVFIDEKGKEDINLLTDGKYGGIGVSIGLRNNEVLIVDIMEGYSAQRQGLRIGDVITKIGDTEVNAANFDDISNYVKGEPGTELKLTIKRDDLEEPLQFNLLREEVVIKNLTFYDFIPEGSNNAYLKLTGYTRGAGAEIKKGLEELSAKREIKSIILDLRGNPGGLLDAAVDVAEKFLKKGQLIVSAVGRDTTQISEHFSSEEPAASNNVKLAVLVDEGTASASEIVAGAIQDHDRGVIVGAKTFGKGLVQTIIPLSYNTSLKITTAKYFTPSGRCIQKIDYSDHNDVLLPSRILTTKTFNTDNKRLVYSAGGITPDSLVADDDIFSIDEDLLAKG
ncbi:MAG TPA: dTMP kinase, partial [Ignavibacteriales bacterium]|nr:dTMP kinase [Ignavibacteriales bacterium]